MGRSVAREDRRAQECTPSKQVGAETAQVHLLILKFPTRVFGLYIGPISNPKNLIAFPVNHDPALGARHRRDTSRSAGRGGGHAGSSVTGAGFF